MLSNVRRKDAKDMDDEKRIQILGYIWALQFFIKRFFNNHYWLKIALITISIEGVYFRIKDGNWGIFIFGLILVTLWEIVFCFFVALDNWGEKSPAQKAMAKEYARKYTAKQLEEYLLKKAQAYMEKKNKR